MRKLWTEQELYTLSMVYPTLGIDAACKELGRSRCSVIGQARKQGLVTGRYWTPEQDAQLIALHPNHRNGDIAKIMGITQDRVESRATHLGLKKDIELLREIGRINTQHPNAIAARIKPGNVPHNKGIKGWRAGGRSTETQFKPGQKPINTWKPIGHERIVDGGYLQRKMTDTGDTRRDYVCVHHLIWIAANGPIPRGHIVVFRNGDKTDIRLENLELITKQENMKRNSVHNWPKEILKVQQMKNGLMRRVNKLIKGDNNV